MQCDKCGHKIVFSEFVLSLIKNYGLKVKCKICGTFIEYKQGLGWFLGFVIIYPSLKIADFLFEEAFVKTGIPSWLFQLGIVSLALYFALYASYVIMSDKES